MTNNQPSVCVYHSADLDGRCSAAIVLLAHPDAELIGMDYGQPFPWDKVQGRDVIMVDFSLQPFVHMLSLGCEAASVLWIDHHKSAIAEIEARMWPNVPPKDAAGLVSIATEVAGKGIRCVLDVSKAACELAWEHFFPGQEMPRAVRLLGRYDVWDHADPDVLPTQWGMRILDNDPAEEQWRLLLGRGRYADLMLAEVIKRGRDVLRYQERQDAEYMRAFAYETTCFGLRCLVVNRGCTNSRAFASAYDPDRHDLMVNWTRGQAGYRVSLYSDKPDIDCSAIANSYGGGGHAGAAGFACACLPMHLLPTTEACS